MQPKQPKSWELRRKDPKLYQFFDKTDQVLVKKPGELAGEQFVMRNCIRCTIYLLDYSDTIYIDDCVDCRMFLGPVESSVFIRGCKKCKMVIACGQFRSKKCEDVQILLMCQSQPIIELSIRMGFGCFRGYYPEFADHLKKVKVDRWNNTWSDLFDFNPEKQIEVPHSYMLFEDTRFEDMMPLISTVWPFDDELNINRQIIPFTSEQRKKPFIEEALLIFYPSASKRLPINELCSTFQPLQNEAPQMIFAEEDDNQDGDVVIDTPDQLYCYLVKSKNQPLYVENYEIFKQVASEQLPGCGRLLDEIVVDNRLQSIFALHVRTENRDIRLLSYLHSTIDLKLHANMREICIIVQDQHKIELLGGLLFANMKDEKGGQ